ncbi:HEAT repeat domain-containing protein [Amycolatopsis samaneae]|uniref:HEAT repeat domain-containing protein n=1 Tax=Amycolatopsis samaneae TaxID=664691 RepID=A0ABW5G7L4_9PSEU
MGEAEESGELPVNLTHRQLVEHLGHHPDVLAQRARQDEEHSKRPEQAESTALYREEAAGLLAELAAAGFPVTEVAELHQRVVYYLDGVEIDLAKDGYPVQDADRLERRKMDYRAAVPILVRWLPSIRHWALASEIVGALSKSFAKKQARPVLLALFRDPPRWVAPHLPSASDPVEMLRTTIGTVLGGFADPSVADEYLAIAQDRSSGAARAGVVADLPRLKDERVFDVLVGLLDDPTVAAWSVRALGKLRNPEAVSRIRELLDHPPAEWDANTLANVKAEAKKALKRLDAAK